VVALSLGPSLPLISGVVFRFSLSFSLSLSLVLLQIVTRSAALRALCSRRVNAAAKFRDLQIENVRGLFDYEQKEAESVYQVRAPNASFGFYM